MKTGGAQVRTGSGAGAIGALVSRLRTRVLGSDAVLSVDALDVAIRALSLATVLLLSFTGYGHLAEGEGSGLWRIGPAWAAGGLLLYNLLVILVGGIPWRRSPGFGLFVLDWLVATVAISGTGGFFGPYVVLYYALVIGAALRVGLYRSLVLVAACSVVYLGLAFTVAPSLEAARLPVLAVMITSLVMVALTAVSMQHAVEVENRRVLTEERSAAQLRLVNDLLNTVWSVSPDIEPVVRAISSASSRAVGADAGVAVLHDDPGELLEGSMAPLGQPLLIADRDPNPLQLSAHERRLVDQVTQTRQPVVVSHHEIAGHQPGDIGQYTAVARGEARVSSVACVPFLMDRDVLGALMVARYSPPRFTPSEVDLLEAIAQQMSVAVRLARLYTAEHVKAVQSAEQERLERDLLSMVSHELRTPLTSIKTCADALVSTGGSGSGEEEAVQVGLARNIERSTDRLIALVDELLDMARLRAGRVSLCLEETNLGTLIEEVAAQMRPVLETREQRLELDLPAEGSARWQALGAAVDRPRIEQVLVNLVSNAHKYAPERATVAVGATPLGDWVEVFVRDQGPGIAPSERELIFEKFYQGRAPEGDGASSKQSLGLGLAIARAIIDLHGGQIGVRSRPGQGSTFYFALLRPGPGESESGPAGRVATGVRDEDPCC